MLLNLQDNLFKNDFFINRILPILAFLFPLFIRMLPEIISWPYPIGFDTLSYINIILNSSLNFNIINFLKSANFFFIIAIIFNEFIKDPFLIIKIFGPILFSILCFSLYLYSRKVLNWNSFKAFLVSFLASIYFVSLRISWDLYRQMLGSIFLIISLIALRISNIKLRIFSVIILGLLNILSHQLTAVLFFIIMIAHFFIEKELKSKIYIFLIIISVFSIFIYQLYNPTIGNIRIPYEKIVSNSWIDLAFFISGFLCYISLPIFPLILLGFSSFKGIDIWSWLIACLIFSYWPLFLPEYSVVSWFRWAILIVYPIIFLSIEGFEKIWKLKKGFSKNIGKILAISILLLNLIMSGYYLLSLPEYQACKYFGEWNNYKKYIQTSMLQNSISISDTEDVIKAMKWFNEKIDKNNSVLILHTAMESWARIFISKIKIIGISEIGLSSQIRRNIEKKLIQFSEENSKNGNEVYTIWWINGKGWYEMPELPSQFKEIQHFGNIGIFKYAP
jgi:hypothetical protein